MIEAGTGATAAFTYAQMLYLLPMALLGTGEAAVSLPEMARETAEQDEELRHQRMRRRLGATLSRVCALAVPAMVVLVLFGRSLITLLLQTGERYRYGEILPIQDVITDIGAAAGLLRTLLD